MKVLQNVKNEKKNQLADKSLELMFLRQLFA